LAPGDGRRRVHGPTRNNEDVQRVRDASDIVGVIGEHLALKPKGREYVCLCPFHDDHNPSMCVVPGKQIFHCFVCGAGGDVFRFVMRYHTMAFPEALRYLAERANIELAPNRGVRPQGPGSDGVTKSDLIEANGIAQGFFRAILNHEEHGRAARALIGRRGIAPEMVEAFGIGAAPDRWDGLIQLIASKGLGDAPFRRAGLLKERESGGAYDALRNRLIFPIRDQIGRPIAFGARRIDDDDEPKYLNSPETPAFNKSATLFGLDRAAQAIKRRRVAVVVEGYTDVVACHQHGIDHVVGTLGTALTKGHASILRRLCDTVVLLFDGDEAGQRAADRAIDVLLSETIDIKIASLAQVSDAKDPDELLAREDGADLFSRAIDRATDLLGWRFDRLRASLDGLGPAAVARRVEDEIRTLVSHGLERLSPLRRRLIVRQIAEAARVEESVVLASMRLGRAPSRGDDAPARRRGKHSPRELIMGCLLCDASLWRALDADEHDLIATTRFGHDAARRVAAALHESVENGTGTSLHAVLDELSMMDPDASLADPEDPVQADPDPADPIDPASYATALQHAVEQRCEGSRERLSRLLAECVRKLVEDAARRTDPAPDAATEDEASRLRAFMERERGLRQRLGSVHGSLSPRRAGGSDLDS